MLQTIRSLYLWFIHIATTTKLFLSIGYHAAHVLCCFYVSAFHYNALPSHFNLFYYVKIPDIFEHT